MFKLRNDTKELVKCRKELVDYCTQDTLAMVELLIHLEVLVKNQTKKEKDILCR
jgi:hypothetical protein